MWGRSILSTCPMLLKFFLNTGMTSFSVYTGIGLHVAGTHEVVPMISVINIFHLCLYMRWISPMGYIFVNDIPLWRHHRGYLECIAKWCLISHYVTILLFYKITAYWPKHLDSHWPLGGVLSDWMITVCEIYIIVADSQRSKHIIYIK